MGFTYEIIKSWADRVGKVNSNEEVLAWVNNKNENLHVEVEKIDFSYNGFWYYDEEEGCIRNKNNSFFQLLGIQEIEDDLIVKEQPIIIQDEIGYLGFVCKKIDGVLHFLIQAKVEPGNVNTIQLSPTIQATKSNFTRKHGGKTPAYLDFFANSSDYHIVVDQIQSEQSSRFLKKRNRNIIVYVDEDVEVKMLDSHRWVTLGQIKELMNVDNLVNMDTRTVLSCLPFDVNELNDENKESIKDFFNDLSMYNSIIKQSDGNIRTQIFNKINDIKMYRNTAYRLVPIKSLKSWKMNKKEIVCKSKYDFKVVYCHIEIEGREVKYWEQPLFEANGSATFGLFTAVIDGIRKFLVRTKIEIGCHDIVELGPTIQKEVTDKVSCFDEVEKLFVAKMKSKNNIIKEVVLSEEGGRFYHEQNRNIIIEINQDEVKDILPDNYFWVDFATLNEMIQYNNCLNIQLRNLVSLLEI